MARSLCRCFEFVFSGGRIPTLRYKQAPIYSKFKRSERSSSSSEKTSSNFSLKWSLHASFHANEFSEEKLWWCENLCHVVVWVHTSTTTHTHRCMRMAQYRLNPQITRNYPGIHSRYLQRGVGEQHERKKKKKTMTGVSKPKSKKNFTCGISSEALFL